MKKGAFLAVAAVLAVVVAVCPIRARSTNTFRHLTSSDHCVHTVLQLQLEGARRGGLRVIEEGVVAHLRLWISLVLILHHGEQVHERVVVDNVVL